MNHVANAFREKPFIQMNKTLIIPLLVVVMFLASCISKKAPYERADNWAIRQNDIPRYFADFDVLYLYPGAFTTNTAPFVAWSENSMSNEAHEFSYSQTVLVFGNRARVFSPFIPTLQHEDYLELLNSKLPTYKDTPLQASIDKAIEAFEVYFKQYRVPQRPYILFGQGQGALILYEVLKKMKKIQPDDGFIAAYFSGLPPMTREKILEDFDGRDIFPAEGEFDLGVIIAWNPILDFSPIPDCALKNAYQMNPINWKTDTTPAPAEDNISASFYNCLFPVRNRQKVVENPCSAVIDPAIGCLRFTPSFPLVELRGQLYFNDDQFHADRHSLFLGNIVENARTRTREYRFKYNWRKIE